MFQTCFECGRRGEVLQSHPLPISPLLQTPDMCLSDGLHKGTRVDSRSIHKGFLTHQVDLVCHRPVPLQSPKTPKPQKCILKSERCHFGPPPRKKGPQKLTKISQKSSFGDLKCPKLDFLDILIDFWGPFSGGVKNSFFRALGCTFGVSAFRGSVGGPGDCKTWRVQIGSEGCARGQPVTLSFRS